ncbi:unnamed protein product [Amoebophrya sp. A120]|nr:unnamed protein product [Amoebophrya sp. A120]|eukprot:GSA120T00025642001.1
MLYCNPNYEYMSTLFFSGIYRAGGVREGAGVHWGRQGVLAGSHHEWDGRKMRVLSAPATACTHPVPPQVEVVDREVPGSGTFQPIISNCIFANLMLANNAISTLRNDKGSHQVFFFVIYIY